MLKFSASSIGSGVSIPDSEWWSDERIDHEVTLIVNEYIQDYFDLSEPLLAQT